MKIIILATSLLAVTLSYQLIYFSEVVYAKTNGVLKPMNLNQYQWKNRLVVVISPKGTNKLLEQQKKLFNNNPSENTDRQLLIFDVASTGALSGNKFDLPDGSGFKVLLIGKDGGIKATYLKPTAMKDIYKEIDSMPMRQDEMKNK